MILALILIGAVAEMILRGDKSVVSGVFRDVKEILS
jgi:hypothetical protein